MRSPTSVCWFNHRPKASFDPATKGAFARRQALLGLTGELRIEEFYRQNVTDVIPRRPAPATPRGK